MPMRFSGGGGLDLARTLIERSPIFLVAIGPQGTGKTTLAEAMAHCLGIPSYDNDSVRKKLVGILPYHHPIGDEHKRVYDDKITNQTYARMCELAEKQLQEPEHYRIALLSGVYGAARRRAPLVEMAERVGASYLFIECRCPPEIAEKRVAAAHKYGSRVSDAGAKVVAGSFTDFQPPQDIAPFNQMTLDTSTTIDHWAAAITHHLRAYPELFPVRNPRP